MVYKRPTTAICANCGKRFEVNPTGRIALYCKPACRTTACLKRAGRPSAEERQRRLIWGVLQDAGLIAADKVLPPRRTSEGER